MFVSAANTFLDSSVFTLLIDCLLFKLPCFMVGTTWPSLPLSPSSPSSSSSSSSPSYHCRHEAEPACWPIWNLHQDGNPSFQSCSCAGATLPSPHPMTRLLQRKSTKKAYRKKETYALLAICLNRLLFLFKNLRKHCSGAMSVRNGTEHRKDTNQIQTKPWALNPKSPVLNLNPAP